MYDGLTSWGCCSLCSRHQSVSPMHFILCVFWKFIWTISIRFQFTAHFYHYFMIYFFFGLNITKIFLNYLSLLSAFCRKNGLLAPRHLLFGISPWFSRSPATMKRSLRPLAVFIGTKHQFQPGLPVLPPNQSYCGRRQTGNCCCHRPAEPRYFNVLKFGWVGLHVKQ